MHLRVLNQNSLKQDHLAIDHPKASGEYVCGGQEPSQP